MKNNTGKIFLIILLILLVLILILGISGYFFYKSYVNNKLEKIQYVEIAENEIEIEPVVEEQLEEYRNILLFGIDARADTFASGRSDCIILVTINNKTKDVNLTSIYRDTYLDINGSLDKITHAYAYGGALLSMNSINKNLDLNVKEFVTVNFDSVVSVVDAVGGVEMPITSAETKYINGYIKEINKVTGHNSPNITSAGTYNLDGVQALAYGRIRYTEGGDYKRTERMRDVLTAVFAKAKKKSVLELNSLLDLLLPHVYTNVSKEEIEKLIPQAFSFSIKESIGWPYNTKGITLDKWYGVPVTLEANVVRLHKELFGEEDYVVSDTVKSISNRIINKTGYRN